MSCITLHRWLGAISCTLQRWPCSALDIFYATSGFTNFDKCVSTPLNWTSQQLELVHGVLSCHGLFGCTRIHLNSCVLEWIGVEIKLSSTQSTSTHINWGGYKCVPTRSKVGDSQFISYSRVMNNRWSTLSPIISWARKVTHWTYASFHSCLPVSLGHQHNWQTKESSYGVARTRWVAADVVWRCKLYAGLGNLVASVFGGLSVIHLRRFGLALRLRWEWLWRMDNRRTWIDL
jgi:hypothetical protein